MQFSDSNTPQIEPEAAHPARRGFFSRLFGSRSKGSSEEKKNELVEQQTLTTEVVRVLARVLREAVERLRVE